MDAKERYMNAARAYEAQGEIRRAAETYAKAGSMGNAARVWLAAGHPDEAAELLLGALNVEVDAMGSLEGPYRAVALKAAECLSLAGDEDRASRAFAALGVEDGGIRGDAARASIPPAPGSQPPPSRPPTPRPPAEAEAKQKRQRPTTGGKRATGWKDMGKGSKAHDKMISDLIAGGRLAAAARVMWDAGRYDEASRYFIDNDLHYEAGMCLADAERFDGAFQQLLLVSPAHKRYRKACVRAIQLAYDLDRFDFEVDRLVTPFVGGGPRQDDEVDAYFMLARMYIDGGYHDGATDAVGRILSFAPQHAEASKLLSRLAPGRRRTTGGSLGEAPERAGVPGLPSLDSFASSSSGSVEAPAPMPPSPSIPFEMRPPRSSPTPAARVVTEAPGASEIDRSAETLPELHPPSDRPPSAPPLRRGGEDEGVAPPAAPIDIGQVIAGRYELLEIIGEGGMATVYRALDLELDTQVALKILKPIPSLVSWLPRFRQELALSRELTHKNIVRVHDIGKHGSTNFISMELLEGVGMDEMVDEAMPLGEGLTLMLQACAALRAAHEKRIVHRDIKPENMFITHDGTLKLMDFGIASSPTTKGMTSFGAVVGTPDYMSPEQISKAGESAPTSDLYALGIVMYEMFTGRLPFQSENLMGLLHQQVNELPVAPIAHNPLIPPSLEAVILRLLEKKPERRYTSATELARALRAVIRDIR